MMETKVKSELAALTENLQRMQDEMIRISDLEGLRSQAETRRMVSKYFISNLFTLKY